MLYRLREALIRFMSGRYGWDMLGFALWILYMILWFVGLFVRSVVIDVLMLAVLVYELFRFFSRNTYARRRENEWFETQYRKVRTVFSPKNRSYSGKRAKSPKDKEHIFRQCPHCKADLRLPRKRGKHTVRCPRCNERFNVRVLF